MRHQKDRNQRGSCWLSALIATGCLLFSLPVVGQDLSSTSASYHRLADSQLLQPEDPDNPNSTSSVSSDAPAEVIIDEDHARFDPGTVDVIGGLSGIFFPYLQAQLDIGLIPISNKVTLSVGATLDVGACLLCELLDFALPVDISSWGVIAMGRGNVHLGALTRAMRNTGLDPFVGLSAGPSFHHFSVSEESGSVEVSQSVLGFWVGLYLGVRYLFTESLFFSGEAGYVIGSQLGGVSVTLSDGRVYETDSSAGYFPQGLNYFAGLGLRF